MQSYGRRDNDQSPLWGVVLCWTSIPPEERTQDLETVTLAYYLSTKQSAMVAIAQEMGASHKLDLMSDTTHLIVGNIDTPKYKYVARERLDIKVLRPSWLDAVRASWMAGGETDVAALAMEHRLPTFFGLKICVTGFEDFTERTGLQESINDNGATYHGDLTKSVTHLVAAAPRGKKYDYARAWGIKIVGIEWVRDSLDRGMALDEDLYDPRRPEEERGIGAVVRTKMPSPPQVLGKRSRSDVGPAQASAQSEPGQRKLRRTASTRLESQSGNIWADIGGEDQGPILNAEPVDLASGMGEGLRRKHSMSERDSAGKVKEEEDSETQGPAGFLQRIGWSGYCIEGFDEKKASVLRQHLDSNGASIYTSQEAIDRDPAQRFIFILPHDYASEDYQELLNSQRIVPNNDEVVTEIWLEKCLYSKSFVEPEGNPLYRPIPPSAVPDFSTLTICPTSFTGIDLLHFSKAVKRTGATYDETLRKQSSVLVCNDNELIKTEKLRYALENKIPVVSVQWLWESIRNKTCRDFEDYAISGSRQTQNSTQPLFYHPTQNPRTDHITKAKSTAYRSSTGSARPRSQRLGQLDLSIEVKQEPNPSASRSKEGQFVGRPDEPETQEAMPLQELSQSKANSSQKRRSKSPNKSQRTKPTELESSSLEMKGSKPTKNSETDTFTSNQDSAPMHTGMQRGASETQQPAISDTTSSNTGTKREDAIDAALATLQAHQQKAAAAAASRPSSASADQKDPHASRRRRPLGRAQSNSSIGLSRHASLDIDGVLTGNSPSASRPSFATIAPIEVEDDFDGLSTQVRLAREESNAFQPSQALGYDDPESAALREKLMRRGGTSSALDGALENDVSGMKRVQEIGRVTDARSHLDGGMEEKLRRRGARRKVLDS